MEGQTKEQKAFQVATMALEAMKQAAVSKPHTAKKIRDFAIEKEIIKKEEVKDFNPNSWAVYMTKATRSDQSQIIKPAGQNGYELTAALAQAEEELPADGQEPEASVAGNQQRESKLYEVLKTWLSGLGYRAGVVAQRKVSGVWKNPDVAGILVTSGVAGGAEVEIITIEAKLDAKRVDEGFFQAVSHKRFANRAYFAFAAKSNDKIPAEFRQVAERFNMGILIIRLTDEAYTSLKGNNTAELELSDENAEIQEYWPATFEPIAPSVTQLFLREILDIKSPDNLYAYGFDPEA